MIKIIPPRAWDFDGPQLETVKVSSSGLVGEDLRRFVKRASHPLALWVRDNPPRPGEAYVHSVAMGATEKYSCNRNADGYTRDMLKRDHPSFEKLARWFYNHNNGNPAKSYGVVKKAWYNDELDRVEVVAALNTTKEAADRNGGLVDTKTINRLESGQDVAVSQSCKVPFDRCIACGHEARTRAHYCGPEKCAKYGGCRDNLGRVYDDGFHLFVDNPKCAFFDLSDVSDTRGADRIAFITGKVASNPDRSPGGAELAELLGLVPPEHILEPATLAAVHTLRKLAAERHYPHPAAPDWDDCLLERRKLASGPTRDYHVPTEDASRHALLAELASAGVVLPPARWLEAASGVSRDKCASLFSRSLEARELLDRADLHELLAEGLAAQEVDSRLSASRYGWMKPTKLAHARETRLGVLKAAAESTQKSAHPAAPEKVAAEARARYLAYQARVLALHPDDDELLRECARHNRCETL